MTACCADPPSAALALTALANLAAARGTATGGKVAAPPHPRPSTLDKLSARLQEKLHGAKAERGTKEGEQVRWCIQHTLLRGGRFVVALACCVLRWARGGCRDGWMPVRPAGQEALCFRSR